MKFFYYAVTITGIMIILAAAGMTLPATGTVLKTFGILNDSGDITFSAYKSSSIYTSLIAIFVLSVASTIIIGSFTRSSPESFIIGGVVNTITALLTGDLIYMFIQINSFNITWLSWTALALIAPLTVGLYISAIEYWRGVD